MTALFIVIGSLSFLMLLLCASAVVYVSITDEIKISVGVFGFKKLIFPSVEQETTSAEEALEKKKASKVKKAAGKITDKQPGEQSLSQTVDFVMTLLQSIFPKAVRLLAHLRFKRVIIRMTVTAKSADKVALQYGCTGGGAYMLLGALRNAFTVTVKEITITPDFVNEKARYDTSFKIKLRLIFILAYGVAILFSAGMSFIRRDKPKGEFPADQKP